MQAARDTHGDVVALRSEEGEVAYLLAHPDQVRHVLATASANYRKTASYDRGRAVLGQALLVRDDAEASERRLLLQRAFHTEALATAVRLVADHLQSELIGYWTPKLGTEFDLNREMDALFRRLLSVAVFGDTELARDPRLAQALDHVFDDLAEVLETPFGRPHPRNQEARGELAILNEWLYARVRRARTGGPDCLLGRLATSESGHGATAAGNDVLRDEAIALLFAGYSTTALAAVGCIKYLAAERQAARAVLAEVTEMAAADLRTAVSSGMPITSAFVQEVLRLRPPAWLLARRAVDDDVVAGYAVPAGTHVLLVAYVTHRHPDFWAEPERFMLQRFSDARPSPYAYFPFGAGFHRCIGSGFAMVLLRLAIAMLCGRFAFIRVRRSGRSSSYRLEERGAEATNA